MTAMTTWVFSNALSWRVRHLYTEHTPKNNSKSNDSNHEQNTGVCRDTIPGVLAYVNAGIRMRLCTIMH